MIVVLAVVELHPGRCEDFLREFRQIIPAVRAENGCLEYFPTVDFPSGLSAQPPVRSDVVTICEKWTSLETLQAHLAAPHKAAYRPKVKEMVIKTTLHVLESAE